MHWYQKSARDIEQEFSADLDHGLSPAKVRDRLHTFGPNLLAQRAQETLFDIFLSQFKSPLIYILLLAAALVLVFGEIVDASVILAVIVINSIVGTFQEGKARNSLARLKSLTKSKALVRRGGEEFLILSENVVVGDVLILHGGDKIVADARLILCENLKTNESVLTGEALPVIKSENTISGNNLVVGDQKNMVFSGTSIVGGYAEAIVVETGTSSELGKISKRLVETADVPLPLAGKVKSLTRYIAFGVLAIAAITFLIGYIRGIELAEILGAVIGLSVSIIPEGLPVAVTIVLAGGVWRMAKAHAIVRQMAAVEAMGNADCLLVDKTGTITTGKMVIRKIKFEGKEVDVDGDGYEPKGKISADLGESKQKKFDQMLSLCALSLSADVIHTDHGGWIPSGDPTEVAMVVLCQKAKLHKKDLEKHYTKELLIPFDSKKRYIEGKFKRGDDKWHVYVGAPEVLSKKLKIDHGLSEQYEKLATKGMRVVGVGVFGPRKKLYGWMLFAIEEEVRPQVTKAVKEAHEAGFRVVMITGDYAKTAKAIAAQVGIFKAGDLVITGAQLEKLSEVELEEKIAKASVFARITPDDKLTIVNAFKKLGHTCAMTGDGVNDAPALQAANLGIGLGSGTQVAKDASDIVLVDNDFATIIGAISEGRSIYLTLKKVILYLFSTSLGEVMVILGALAIGLPLPLVAVQIIWLNFVTDGFFVVALSQDTPRHKLVSKSDVSTENLVDRLMLKRMVMMSFVMFVVTLPLFVYFLQNYSLSYARTIALVILSACQWFNAFNVRSRTLSVFERKLDNKFLLASFVLVFGLQILVVNWEVGNRILHTEPISLWHWSIAIFVSSGIVWAEELRKKIMKNHRLTETVQTRKKEKFSLLDFVKN